MVVFSEYFARSSAGTTVCVAVGAGVSVGKGVIVAAGMDKSVGVSVAEGVMDDVQEDENERRKRERTMREEMVLFRMNCILTKKPPTE